MTKSLFPIIDTISSIEPYVESYSHSGLDFDDTVDLSLNFFKPLAHAALNTAITGFMNYQRRLETAAGNKPLPEPTLDSRAELEDAEKPNAVEANELSARGLEHRSITERILAEATAAARVYNTLYADLSKCKSEYDHALPVREMIKFRMQGDPLVDMADVKALQESMRIDEATAREILVADGYKRMSALANNAEAIALMVEGAGSFGENDELPEITLATQLRWINKVVTKVQDAANGRIITSIGRPENHRRALTYNEMVRAACVDLLKLALNLISDNRQEFRDLLDNGVDIPDNSEQGIRDAVTANLKRRIAKMKEGAKEHIAAKSER